MQKEGLPLNGAHKIFLGMMKKIQHIGILGIINLSFVLIFPKSLDLDLLMTVIQWQLLI
jgi:hypothetical protein